MIYLASNNPETPYDTTLFYNAAQIYNLQIDCKKITNNKC